MDEYTTDFGISLQFQKVRIQGTAPAMELLYMPRQGVGCSGVTYFDYRHLKVLFPDGRILKYPVPKVEQIPYFVYTLKQNGAICIDLIGERFATVPNVFIGNPTFRTEPFENLPARKTYAPYTYKYFSDVPDLANGVEFSARIAIDSVDLIECATGGMEDVVQRAGGICASGNIVDPRHYILKARSIDDFNSEGFKENKVIRKVIVSRALALDVVSIGIARCAECLGYQGESISNIHIVINDYTP